MVPLQVWPMVNSNNLYIGTAIRGALYLLCYLYVTFLLPLQPHTIGQNWSGPIKLGPTCFKINESTKYLEVVSPGLVNVTKSLWRFGTYHFYCHTPSHTLSHTDLKIYKLWEVIQKLRALRGLPSSSCGGLGGPSGKDRLLTVDMSTSDSLPNFWNEYS